MSLEPVFVDPHADDEIQEGVEAADLAWQADNLELTTVGVDVGSSTSHLMFAHLHLQRLSQDLSSRFVVVERRVLHRSEILLTPYRADGLIDVEALARFVDAAYAAAGLSPATVDTGAVILTGTALERPNARAIAELFATTGGKFVCASAGHNLEALLAAHGSGAVGLSRETAGAVLNVDVGGGTTKLALVQDGQVLATLAIAAGARLVAFDPDGAVVRIEPSAERLAARLGVPLRPGEPLDQAHRCRLAEAMAEAIVAAIRGGRAALDPDFVLVGDLPPQPRPDAITFSGGVSEFVYARERSDYGDLAGELAAAIRARQEQLPAPVAEPPEGIRATVVGASQFSVQVSGNTIFVSDPELLPLRNVPVVLLALGSQDVLDADDVAGAIRRRWKDQDLLAGPGPAAVAITWHGEPSYRNLRALAEGILAAYASRSTVDGPLVAAFQGDVGATLGRILVAELGVERGVVAVDGLDLRDLDFVDVGERLLPSNVVPVVVKSLVFPDPVAVAPPHLIVASTP